MARYHVTRVRHQLEGTIVEAANATEAIAKARKSLRKDWQHIDSKRRRSYKTEEVSSRVKSQ